MIMVKIMQVACCLIGAGLIGFFANRLDTVLGSTLFAAGTFLIAVSTCFNYLGRDRK